LSVSSHIAPGLKYPPGLLARLVAAVPLKQTTMKPWELSAAASPSSPPVASMAEPPAQLYERVGCCDGPTVPTTLPPEPKAGIIRTFTFATLFAPYLI
jgi:hypothetical protein